MSPVRGSRLALPGNRSLDLSSGALVMGVINVTPDSFYADSRKPELSSALEAALAMEGAGAAIIDIGGESTRPGAGYVDEDLEASRVVPLVRAIREVSSIPISVDTRKSRVAREAALAGADIVNDVSALESDPALVGIVREFGLAIVLMHKLGDPATMQSSPSYRDAPGEVLSYLLARARHAEEAGIPEGAIAIDPGIGFGKRLEDNLALLASLDDFAASGYPVLVGLSRKSFIGALTGKGPAERLPGTIAANAWAALHGASILRVHDVAEAVDSLKVLRAIAAARR
jgi:dihydropteroate synthase